MGALSEYYNYLQQTHQQLPEGTPVVTTPQQPIVAQPVTTQPVVTQPQQQELPQVDTSNAMQSLANILVTPAEREAQERKLLENKRKMIAWTGLFDGLRQLGNLYAVSKGASPQQYTDKPYQAIEQSYQQERQLQDALQKYRNSYAQQLYNIQRQGEQDAINRDIKNAQIKWYENRDEIARQKAELDKMKAVRVIKQKDGSLMKYDPVSGTIEPLTEADPLYVELMNTRTEAEKKRLGLIGAPVTTTTTDSKGNTRTSVKTYGNGSGNKQVNSNKPSGKTIEGYTKSGSKGSQNSNKNEGRKGRAYGNGGK